MNLNYQNIIFEFFPKILILSIPIFLITGPFFPDLALSLVVIIFLIIVLREKKFQIFDNKFFYFFIFFYFYLILNSLFQNQNFDSIKISIFYFRFGFFCYALMYFLSKDPKLLKYIFYSLIICFTILSFDGLYQYYFKKNIIGFELVYPGPRVSSFFGDELIMGSYLSRLFPILFGLTIYFVNSKKLLYLIPFWTLIATLTFLSGERTAIFFFSLSLIMMSILFFKNKSYVRIILVLFIISSSLILIFSDSARERVVNETINQMFNSKWESKEVFILTRQHDEHYTSAYRMFLNNKLFGVGVKNFRNFCSRDEYNISDYTCSPHPHNTYIQLLSETGIIGFIIIFYAFIILNLKLFLHFIKKFSGKQFFDDLQICMLVALYLTLWPLIPSGNFFNNWLNIIYYFPIGILMWSFSTKIQQK